MSESTTGFGKYNLIAELGHGGMADVFLAVVQGPAGFASFNKLIVVKRLKASLVDEPEFVSMLVDEARLAARLSHPNVVQTTEVGQVGDQYYIAMEYLDGQPYHRVNHRSRGGMALSLKLLIVSEMLAGLHYAHELADYDGSPLGVVHRDVSPHNIFVTYDGQVKLVDFGIAKAEGRESETRTGVVKGKVTYMAPEQAKGASVDRRADLFAVGVILWEAITGARMWKGMPELTVLHRLISGEIPKIVEAMPDVDPALAAICDKALAWKVADRYATAAEFQEAVEAYAASVGKRAGRRELESYVCELFAEKRKELRALIESQIASLKDQSAMSLAKIDASADSVSITPSRPNVKVELDSRPVSSKTNHTPTMLSGEPPRSASDATAATLVGETRTFQRRARRSALQYFGIAAVIVAIGGVFWVTTKLSASPPAASDPQVPPPPAAPEKQADVAVTLRASPPTAKFVIDDGVALENPFVGKFERDGQLHTLRVAAPGYIAKSKMLRFSEDIVIDLALEPEPEPEPTAKSVRVIRTPGRPPPPRPPPPSTPTTVTAPTGGGKQPKPIDTGTPW